jgi:DNA-binding transcriptional ArsR family regulator
LKEVKRLTQKTLVELLLKYGELTVPKISELLEVNPANVDYHLKVLVEKGIVVAKKKRYGSKYCVNEKCLAPSNMVYMVFSLFLALVIFGAIWLCYGWIYEALLFLVASNILGAMYFVGGVSKQRKDKVEALLRGLGS